MSERQETKVRYKSHLMTAFPLLRFEQGCELLESSPLRIELPLPPTRLSISFLFRAMFSAFVFSYVDSLGPVLRPVLEVSEFVSLSLSEHSPSSGSETGGGLGVPVSASSARTSSAKQRVRVAFLTIKYQQMYEKRYGETQPSYQGASATLSIPYDPQSWYYLLANQSSSCKEIW